MILVRFCENILFAPYRVKVSCIFRSEWVIQNFLLPVKGLCSEYSVGARSGYMKRAISCFRWTSLAFDLNKRFYYYLKNYSPAVSNFEVPQTFILAAITNNYGLSALLITISSTILNSLWMFSLTLTEPDDMILQPLRTFFSEVKLVFSWTRYKLYMITFLKKSWSRAAQLSFAFLRPFCFIT